MNDELRARDDLLSGPASMDDDAAEAQPGVAGRRRWSFLTEMVVLFAVALSIALVIKTFVVQPFFIPSGSMENTLQIGDKVLVNKLVYHIRPIGRGDIVVFDGAGSWDPPAAPTPPSSNPLVRVYDATLGRLLKSIGGLFGTAPGQTDYIKRVIGIPGDHVVCCNARHQITVNGVPLSEKSYLYPGAQPSQYSFNIVVPPGQLWVMGDNRTDSADSRYHDCQYPGAGALCRPYDREGTIPVSSVIGRAFIIVWPPSRIRILAVPATFGQPALNKSDGGTRAARSAPAALAYLGSGIPVQPSAPYLPLAAGFAVALPVTLLERRLRTRSRRLARRRRVTSRRD